MQKVDAAETTAKSFRSTPCFHLRFVITSGLIQDCIS